ncbi:hypothetical protein HHK36_027645 [Tetracentron sinense]|uniref:Protein SGT1 homolog n=1 Tax=Tetracentron sinense TaxID=13715 RepID=A0A834YHW1_TETSI|nr:hypothetical protein HHK36_027645 [Tetracentron sinense]
MAANTTQREEDYAVNLVEEVQRKLNIHNLDKPILIKTQMLKNGVEVYKQSIVGTFLTDHPLNMAVAKKTMIRAWNSKNSVTAIDLENEFIIFKFSKAEKVDRVLRHQPWSFNGHPLMMLIWKPDLNVANLEVDTIPLWVQAHGLPPEYLTEDVGQAIADKLGPLLEVDLPHEEQIRAYEFPETGMLIKSKQYNCRSCEYVIKKGNTDLPAGETDAAVTASVGLGCRRRRELKRQLICKECFYVVFEEKIHQVIVDNHLFKPVNRLFESSVMAPELEKMAKEAFVDDNFELALDLYTQAIELDPKNADLFADRAQANIKLKNYTVEAVADANRAIELDPSMAKAYLRKGTACIKLEEYQTAKEALEIGASLASSDSRFTNLIKECNARIAEETGDLPNQLTQNGPSSAVSPSVGSQSSDITLGTVKDAGPGHAVSSQTTVVTSTEPKYRHGYYQKPEEVVVTIYVKGIPAKNVVVDFGEQILSVTIDISGEDVYAFQHRLFGKIIPEKCRYEVLSTKVEIRLAKAEAINWSSLEFSKENAVPQKINVSSSIGSQRPTYPSSKSRAVDWDRLEAEVKKEEKEEKLDGDAALNQLFRGIYQDADEDTRRAMSKSFVESNGTVLSTNWKEVGKKKVEGSAPDGMEMKKWEY